MSEGKKSVKKRNSSVSYRGGGDQSHGYGSFTPQNQSRVSNQYGNPHSILKSGRKEKKGRPKTAERLSGGYNPNRRGSGKAQRAGAPMANSGMNFSPYEVPNVAKLPANPSVHSNQLKQVSFAGRQA